MQIKKIESELSNVNNVKLSRNEKLKGKRTKNRDFGICLRKLETNESKQRTL